MPHLASCVIEVVGESGLPQGSRPSGLSGHIGYQQKGETASGHLASSPTCTAVALSPWPLVSAMYPRLELELSLQHRASLAPSQGLS